MANIVKSIPADTIDPAEETMSIKCKTFGSYLYCHGKNKKDVYVFPKKKMSLSDCPESVIEAFMNDDYDAEIIIKEEIESEWKNLI